MEYFISRQAEKHKRKKNSNEDYDFAFGLFNRKYFKFIKFKRWSTAGQRVRRLFFFKGVAN